jgi:photosystem II stability/assembly factor-like uncharacterized protein
VIRALAAAIVLGAVHLAPPQLGVVAVNELTSKGPRLYVSTDLGAHFDAVGPRLSRNTAIDDAQFLDRDHGWFVGWSVLTVRARLYRTVDGGRSWRSVEVASHGVHGGAIDTIQFLDRRHGWLVAQEPTAPSASLSATSDGGATWRRVSQLPQVAPARFQTRRIAWQAGGYAGSLFRSVDGGRHWRRVPLLPRSETTVYGLPAFFGDTVLAPVTRLDGGRIRLIVYRSDDGGGRWHRAAELRVVGTPPNPQTCPSQAVSVAFAAARTWWAAAPGSVYRTTDAGRTWSRSAGLRRGCAFPAIEAVSADAAWLTSGSRLRATRDGGAHWRDVHP